MTQNTTPSAPGVPAVSPTMWPPSGTVIPFPLPWGQTGCCPPGGMDALMKCYCDIQAASAFIGQIMIDQINNNPDVVAAIIAAIEKSGSSVPLIGVTNGQPAQPGQVGEYIVQLANFSYAATDQTQPLSVGVLQPGDWQVQAVALFSTGLSSVQYFLSPQPAGFSNELMGISGVEGAIEAVMCLSEPCQALISVPTLLAFSMETNKFGTGAAGTGQLQVFALRVR